MMPVPVFQVRERGRVWEAGMMRGSGEGAGEWVEGSAVGREEMGGGVLRVLSSMEVVVAPSWGVSGPALFGCCSPDRTLFATAISLMKGL